MRRSVSDVCTCGRSIPAPGDREQWKPKGHVGAWANRGVDGFQCATLKWKCVWAVLGSPNVFKDGFSKCLRRIT